jgi:hypothetical protein
MSPFADFHPALILLIGAAFRASSSSGRLEKRVDDPAAAYSPWPPSRRCRRPGEGAAVDSAGSPGASCRGSPIPLTFLSVDGLSKAFGYIFTINAVAAFVFAFYVKQQRPARRGAHLHRGGSRGGLRRAISISLYVFWEVMADRFDVRDSGASDREGKGFSAFRYVSDPPPRRPAFFLAGTRHHRIAQTGSIAFDGFDFATDRQTPGPG